MKRKPLCDQYFSFLARNLIVCINRPSNSSPILVVVLRKDDPKECLLLMVKSATNSVSMLARVVSAPSDLSLQTNRRSFPTLNVSGISEVSQLLFSILCGVSTQTPCIFCTWKSTHLQRAF